MPLGFLLLFSIGKSGAILTIYMALHQAVKTAGKNIENRPHSQNLNRALLGYLCR